MYILRIVIAMVLLYFMPITLLKSLKNHLFKDNLEMS